MHVLIEGAAVKTVRVTLDEELVAKVDEAARRLKTTRSAFTREALRAALARMRERDLERTHREGYGRHPIEPGEVDAWLDEQAWPD